MSPLTLEAQLFANTLNKYGPAFNKMDLNLAKALENVIYAIDKFLNQNPRNIEDTTHACSMPEEIPFQIVYACTECNEILKNPPNATLHLVKHLKNIKNTVKQKSNPERRKNKKERKQKPPVIPPLPKSKIF